MSKRDVKKERQEKEVRKRRGEREKERKEMNGWEEVQES